ncbi:MAG: hypothetical protein FJ368_03180 [Pelagibacterales bacterium]|nr:hypothetical protein [Pelagibacterales bacterium]
MTKHLLTTSLLNSFSWYLKESFTKTEAEQRQEFLQTLRREKTPTTEDQQKGLDFEYLVEKTCDWEDGEIHWAMLLSHKCQKLKSLGITDYKDAVSFLDKNLDYIKCVKEIGKIVQKSLWQQSVKKDLKVGNHDFLLYGKTDVIKRDTVFDIKFTSNYELGKFQDSSQHLIYLYCSDLPKFSYLISDGKDWWREDYFNHAGIENEIKSKVSEFLDYLKNDKEAKELYFNNWISK